MFFLVFLMVNQWKFDRFAFLAKERSYSISLEHALAYLLTLSLQFALQELCYDFLLHFLQPSWLLQSFKRRWPWKRKIFPSNRHWFRSNRLFFSFNHLLCLQKLQFSIELLLFWRLGLLIRGKVKSKMFFTQTFDWDIIMIYFLLFFLYDNWFWNFDFLRFMDWFVPAVKTSVHAKRFLSVFHAIILRYSEAVCFESRNIIIFLNQTGYLTYFSVAIAID